MYILIRKNYTSLKADIKKKIETGEILTWEFVVEENRSRLMHTGSEKQFDDVLLRFITSHVDGQECLKIVPRVKIGLTVNEIAKAESHLGLVLGRFAEILNCHFTEIGTYETILQ